MSKLVVAGLLGLLGAVVILGLKDLGERLDARLRDRETLGVVISETMNSPSKALGMLSSDASKDAWAEPEDLLVIYQVAAWADLEDGSQALVYAAEDIESLGLVDDFHLLASGGQVGEVVPFQIDRAGSEAYVAEPILEITRLSGGENVLLGSVERMALALSKGFTRTTIVRARSIEHVRTIHSTVEALAKVEGRRMRISSNLRILEELERVRDIQKRALLFVTLGASLVLGLVFGSLAWMEFREERYLLSLIRSFGVGRMTLLVHALVENCLLAVGGVLIGFVILGVGASQLDLEALQMQWLSEARLLANTEGRMLVLGAAMGGVLSCVPVAVGLRKSLGLILK